jgi:hypothetical protein
MKAVSLYSFVDTPLNIFSFCSWLNLKMEHLQVQSANYIFM